MYLSEDGTKFLSYARQVAEQAELLRTAQDIRKASWLREKESGLDFIDGKETARIAASFPSGKLLFADLVNGRNILRNN